MGHRRADDSRLECRPGAKNGYTRSSQCHFLRFGEWRYLGNLPHAPWILHCPLEGTVRDYFHQWRCNRIWDKIHDALRERVREKAGREATPRAGSIDSQGVKLVRTASIRGFDAGKENQQNQTPYCRWYLGAPVGNCCSFCCNPRPGRGQTGLGKKWKDVFHDYNYFGQMADMPENWSVMLHWCFFGFSRLSNEVTIRKDSKYYRDVGWPREHLVGWWTIVGYVEIMNFGRKQAKPSSKWLWYILCSEDLPKLPRPLLE